MADPPKHLLIYGYFHPGHLAEMNLSTGHLIPVTTAQPPVMDGATAERRLVITLAPAGGTPYSAAQAWPADSGPGIPAGQHHDSNRSWSSSPLGAWLHAAGASDATLIAINTMAATIDGAVPVPGAPGTGTAGTRYPAAPVSSRPA